jgi:hypothetical protein
MLLLSFLFSFWCLDAKGGEVAIYLSILSNREQCEVLVDRVWISVF